MALAGVNVTDLPTNYGYYTSGGIQQGLTADKPNFYLNNKEIFVYSGAMHYFRVPRAYWRDRLRKMRAAGLNTVETYVPWNLHEPRAGEFDFGNGENDMSDFLHLEEFLKIAQEEDLFTIIRSGPFICAEFEFGGHPSWLLRDNDIEFRTSNPTYVKHVTNFFNVLLPILAAFQFTNGGSIIMFQVENEYSISGKHDLEYLKILRTLMLNNGIVELLVTADNPNKGTYGTLPELFLMTGNFDQQVKTNLDRLKAIQPGRPTMTMEFWGGWFDYWGDEHNKNKTLAEFQYNYEEILKYPSSVNIYMFHGGTNFGFLNGAENLNFDEWETDYNSITSSYEYVAPLDEAGDYTDKYWATKELLEKYNPIKTALPSVPEAPQKTAYASITMEQELFLYDMLQTIQPVYAKNVIAMEKIEVNNGNGQSYGYVVYRKTNLNIPENAYLKIEGRICDTAMVLINGILVSPWLQKAADLNGFGTSRIVDSTLLLTKEAIQGATLDIVVENWGRVNVGVYKQFKGIWQGNGVKLNDEYIYDWTIYPLEFKSAWTTSLTGWSNFLSNSIGPAMYKGNLYISENPVDTFVYMEKWIKGIVIVNGFVIGRYARMGPIQTLYLPAPLLRQGNNEIVVFEHFRPSATVDFQNHHVYNNY
ncbi:beta-galactosidase-1-like protein 2 isoform X1 [Diorhabda carinulata]|uniref:beta-galactosidase-1-like protein 2 isoform X1 n=2 Tax=Diorhabda carinulata TaxID=1163345 RepID=UPI0025A2435B|nr:beta-galactosidase-1-like protein 2 isoform X1 [Diorhabda carinulata]